MVLRSHCPVNYALEQFGDKWSLLIIRDMMFFGKRHYNEFFDSSEKVSTSVLGERLKSLEAAGIISKGKDEVKKSRIKYSLTQKGIDLLPVMVDLIVWGAKFDSETGADPDFLIREKKNRSELLKSLKQKLEAEHLNVNTGG